MSRKKVIEQLHTALRQNDLVQLRRSLKGADRLEGYVVAVGSRWVVIAAAASGEPNGWTVVRRSDLRSIREGDGERFMRRVFELDGCWPPVGPTASLALDGTVRELVDSAAAAFPLVTIFIEAEDPDVCYIGRPLRWTDKKLYWQDLDLNAEWNPIWHRYRQTDITRIDVGGRYETALARVGEITSPAL